MYNIYASMPASQLVNKIGKYLYNNIDGAYSFAKSANTYDVTFILLYETPKELRPEGAPEDMKEMHITLSIACYQDKIRVSATEISPEERTIGFYTFNVEKMQDLAKAKKNILDKITKRVATMYEDYDFLF